MDRQLYERMKAAIEEVSQRHMRNLDELWGFIDQDIRPKIANPAKPKIAPQMKTLKTIPSIEVHTNGKSHETKTAIVKEREGVRIPCQTPSCGKQTQRPKQCPECTKTVCSLHWSKKGMCNECASRPQ